MQDRSTPRTFPAKRGRLPSLFRTMLSASVGWPWSPFRIVKIQHHLNLDRSVVHGAFNHHFLDARQAGEIFNLAEEQIDIAEIAVELQADGQFVKLVVAAGCSLQVDRPSV